MPAPATVTLVTSTSALTLLLASTLTSPEFAFISPPWIRAFALCFIFVTKTLPPTAASPAETPVFEILNVSEL